MQTFWNYGQHDQPGWIQAGNIYGDKCGCWVKEHAVKHIMINFAEATGGYWLQIDGVVQGNWPSLEQAAQIAEQVLARSAA